jgi:hypothetical protein
MFRIAQRSILEHSHLECMLLSSAEERNGTSPLIAWIVASWSSGVDEDITSLTDVENDGKDGRKRTSKCDKLTSGRGLLIDLMHK